MINVAAYINWWKEKNYVMHLNRYREKALIKLNIHSYYKLLAYRNKGKPAIMEKIKIIIKLKKEIKGTSLTWNMYQKQTNKKTPNKTSQQRFKIPCEDLRYIMKI